MHFHNTHKNLKNGILYILVKRKFNWPDTVPLVCFRPSLCQTRGNNTRGVEMNNISKMSSLNEVNHVGMLPRSEVDISRGKLLSLYQMKGWTVKQIANYFNCSRDVIIRHISFLGLSKAKTKQEVNKILSKVCVKNHLMKLVEGRFKNNRKPQIYKCECGERYYITWQTIENSINYYGGIFVCRVLIPYGEFLVENYLKNADYDYKKQYKFVDLVDKSNLLFDFAVFNQGKLLCLIEHDGKYHDKDSQLSKLNDSTLHDKMKNQYCKEKDIPLLRINKYKRIPEQIESFVGKLS